MATIIYDVTQLQDMNLDLTADYELGSDIDASATVGWNGGLGFLPVGDNVNNFTGTFDGKGHIISSLFINRPSPAVGYWRCGLFGKISSTARISNVTLANCNITAQQAVGALVGSNYGSVTNCHSSGSVTGDRDAIGGIIGYNDDIGICTQCSSSCTISGRDSVGGCIGQNYGTASMSYATGAVTGSRNYAGGFAGTCEANCDVDRCFATGNVVGVDYVGGFVGYADYPINDCYARGNATASSDYAGGFVGELGSIDATSIITNCYSTGIPNSAGANEGGFCASNLATIANCFWDTESSSKATSDGGIGKTTAELKDIATIQAAGWAVSTIWNVLFACNNGYPCLINVNICCAAFLGLGPAIVGDKVSLEAIRNLEIVYGGRFYISKSGDAIYESRYHRNV